MNFGKIAIYFPEKGAGRGAKAIWKFSENSSILAKRGFPKIAVYELALFDRFVNICSPKLSLFVSFVRLRFENCCNLRAFLEGQNYFGGFAPLIYG